MKRLLVLLSALAMAAFMAGPVSAQSLYIHGGAGVPSSDAFSNSHETGFDLGVSVGYPLTNYLEGLVRGSYDRFQNKTGISNEFSSWSATANLKLKAPVQRSRFMPYALAGGGLYHLGFEGNLESKFGMAFGAGVDIRTSRRVNLMVEPSYSLVFTEGENIQFFPLRAGASVRLGR